MLIPSTMQTIVVMVRIQVPIVTLVPVDAARADTISVAGEVSAYDMSLLNQATVSRHVRDHHRRGLGAKCHQA